MATSKRERQKAQRRAKLEAQQKKQKQKNALRKTVIVAIVAVLVLGSAAWVFEAHKPSTVTIPSTTTTTTTPTTTTTIASAKGVAGHFSVAGFAPIADPLPSGTWGSAPTVTVPTTAAPKVLEAEDLIKGEGAPLEKGDTATMEYVLATYSTHKVVQSSWTDGAGAFSTTWPGNLITGWNEGLAGMRVGGRRELIIPPSVGYGASSPGSGIAANDTLVFVVDLLSVKK
jgi:peptidylprolyl isomerase